MQEKIARIRIPEELYKEYKILCVTMNLSIPKQTTELIRHFVAIQQENIKTLHKGK